jgi:hypothetical protein
MVGGYIRIVSDRFLRQGGSSSNSNFNKLINTSSNQQGARFLFQLVDPALTLHRTLAESQGIPRMK